MDQSMTELRSVTCHMGSHSDHIAVYATQVSAPRLNPSHAGRYSIYLPRRDGRLSWPCYSEMQPSGVELATSRSQIQRPNHWATKCVCVAVAAAQWVSGSTVEGGLWGGFWSVRGLSYGWRPPAVCPIKRQQAVQSAAGDRLQQTQWREDCRCTAGLDTRLSTLC